MIPCQPVIQELGVKVLPSCHETHCYASKSDAKHKEEDTNDYAATPVAKLETARVRDGDHGGWCLRCRKCRTNATVGICATLMLAWLLSLRAIGFALGISSLPLPFFLASLLRFFHG